MRGDDVKSKEILKNFAGTPSFSLMTHFTFVGLGKQIALSLSNAGAHVIALSRTESTLQALKQEVGDP